MRLIFLSLRIVQYSGCSHSIQKSFAYFATKSVLECAPTRPNRKSVMAFTTVSSDQTLFKPYSAWCCFPCPLLPFFDLAVVAHVIVKSLKCTAGAFSCRRLPMVDLVQSASLQTYTPTTAHRRPPYSGRPAAAALRTFREGR